MVVWQALDALSHQLELCKIDEKTRVVVLLDADTTRPQIDLMRAAIARIGAEALEVCRVHPASPDQNGLIQDVVRSADVLLVVGPQSRQDIDALDTSRCEVLRFADNLSPHTFPPHANLGRRVNTLHERLIEANQVVLLDDNGTNLEVSLAAGITDCDHGYIGGDQATATFPAGWVSVVPASGAVHGDIVLMPGDTNLATGRHLSSPVRLEIVNDLITTIGGESADADVIRALLEAPAMASAYGFASITIGLNQARTPLTVFDDRIRDPRLARLLGGVITVSFGDNLTADRPCPQTVTFALPRRSLHIDNLPAVSQGDLQGHFAPDVYEL